MAIFKLESRLNALEKSSTSHQPSPVPPTQVSFGKVLFLNALRSPKCQVISKVSWLSEDGEMLIVRMSLLQLFQEFWQLPHHLSQKLHVERSVLP